MNEKSPQAQIASKIKAVNNILITVSRDPSVDELAAALGLTFMLDKISKHTTAVFSGKIPPAINFLNPEKTFEDNADSLRDFIISLDKEKASHIRLKAEEDYVRVYITPYKTTISDKDLTFGEGDFNIELVIVIGVDKREELDDAILTHGRILHSATVATINTNDNRDALGTISWHDASVSSYCELITRLDGDISDKSLIDEHIATALLTGVVSATDQFRNDRTSPATMSLAANLMSKGANQQLIATELSTADGESSGDGRAVNLQTDVSAESELSLNREDDPDQPSEPKPPDHPGYTSETTEEIIQANTYRVATAKSEAALATANTKLKDVTLPQPESDTQPAEPIESAEIAQPIEPVQPIEPAAPPVEATASEQPVDLRPGTLQSPPSSEMTEDQYQTDEVIPTQSESGLSHGTPYVEESIGAPINAAVMADEELPLTSDNPTISLESTEQHDRVIQPVDTTKSPDLDLPLPPPILTPGLGEMPPAYGADSIANLGLPPMPVGATDFSSLATTPPSSPASSDKPANNDPEQYQIPTY